MGHKAQMNIKHVGSIAAIHREIDDYMRHQVTSHRAIKFSPQRTSNPAVAAQWEARVQELHAKTQVFHKKARKSVFVKAPNDRAALGVVFAKATSAYEIVRHNNNGNVTGVTIWYHPDGEANTWSVSAHRDGSDAANHVEVLKLEALATYRSIYGAPI